MQKNKEGEGGVLKMVESKNQNKKQNWSKHKNKKKRSEPVNGEVERSE